MLTNRERLILLNLIPGIGSTQLRRLLDAFGDLDRVWTASARDLQEAAGIGSGLAQHIAAGRHDESRLRQELSVAQREGVTIITLEDAEYPKPLRTISDPPLALYVRGTLASTDEVAVALVGARHASLYGLQCAERLGYDLALRGVTVISGLARGIDAAAHRGALKTPGRTLAVLGSGLNRLYPPEHEPLANEIVRQGALISEYPLGTPPLAHNFPRRNRLISGLSLGVVVVEAAQRSGALISADCALEQGREVFAVPGPITTVTSQGTHHLLKQGARLVTSVDDILEELRLTPPPLRDNPPQAGVDQSPERFPGEPIGEVGHSVVAIRLPETEERVFACVEADRPRDIDAIVVQSGLAIPEVSSALLQLELKRVIQQLPGKQFIRKTPQASGRKLQDAGTGLEPESWSLKPEA